MHSIEIAAIKQYKIMQIASKSVRNKSKEEKSTRSLSHFCIWKYGFSFLWFCFMHLLFRKLVLCFEFHFFCYHPLKILMTDTPSWKEKYFTLMFSSDWCKAKNVVFPCFSASNRLMRLCLRQCIWHTISIKLKLIKFVSNLKPL